MAWLSLPRRLCIAIARLNCSTSLRLRSQRNLSDKYCSRWRQTTTWTRWSLTRTTCTRATNSSRSSQSLRQTQQQECCHLPIATWPIRLVFLLRKLSHPTGPWTKSTYMGMRWRTVHLSCLPRGSEKRQVASRSSIWGRTSSRTKAASKWAKLCEQSAACASLT